MTTSALGQLNRKGAHWKTALSGTKICALVTGNFKTLCFPPVDIGMSYPGDAVQAVREKMRWCVQRCRHFAQDDLRNTQSIGVHCFVTTGSHLVAAFKVNSIKN